MSRRQDGQDLVQLKRSAAEGSDAALDQLLRRLHPPLERFLHRRLSSPYARHFAADATQEALLRIVRSLEDCQGRSNGEILAWALAIARNCALDLLRSNWFRFITGTLRPGLDGWTDTSSAGPQHGDKALFRLVHSIHGELAESTQQIFWLRLVEGDSWQEIGDAFQISASAAKRRFQRGQDRLRNLFDDRLARLSEEERAAIVARLGEMGVRRW